MFYCIFNSELHNNINKLKNTRFHKIENEIYNTMHAQHQTPIYKGKSLNQKLNLSLNVNYVLTKSSLE